MIRRKFFIGHFIFIFIISCLNTEERTPAANKDGDKRDTFESCNCDISFSETSQSTEIYFFKDTSRKFNSLKECFGCIENIFESNEELRDRFIKHSEIISIELPPYYDEIKESLNWELINFADTSVYWDGKIEDLSDMRKKFFNFIVKSGYSKSWEDVFSNLLGDRHQWVYGAERTPFIYGTELSKISNRVYQKEIYPLGFEGLSLHKKRY